MKKPGPAPDWMETLGKVMSLGDDSGRPLTLDEAMVETFQGMEADRDEQLADFYPKLGKLMQEAALVEHVTVRVFAYLMNAEDFEMIREEFKKEHIDKIRDRLGRRLPSHWREAKPLLRVFTEAFEERNRAAHRVVWTSKYRAKKRVSGLWRDGESFDLKVLDRTTDDLRALHRILLQVVVLATLRQGHGGLASWPDGYLTWRCVNERGAYANETDQEWESLARALGFSDFAAAHARFEAIEDSLIRGGDAVQLRPENT